MLLNIVRSIVPYNCTDNQHNRLVGDIVKASDKFLNILTFVQHNSILNAQLLFDCGESRDNTAVV